MIKQCMACGSIHDVLDYVKYCRCDGVLKVLDTVTVDPHPTYYPLSSISPVQALKDIVISTEQMLKDGEINLENYQNIVEQTVQSIKEIGLKNG